MDSRLRPHCPGRFLARFLFVTVAAFLLASCAGAQSLPSVRLDIMTAGGVSVPVQAELARTGAEQEKGYMNRETIPDGTGMLFVYSSDRKMYFWMKNTPHALSIAYIDSSGVIREIHDMKPLSLATVESSASVRYALEVPKGWFERAGVRPGDKISADSLAAALRVK